MRITPAAPRVPYMAAAEASFKTSIDAMFSGGTELRLPGTPSTRTSGVVFPDTDTMPRRLISVPAPGSPEGRVIVRPATLPLIKSPALLKLPTEKSSGLTDATALVTSPFFCVP